MKHLIRLQAFRILAALAAVISTAYVLSAGHRW
jgi:hypothetical protein